MTRRIMLVLFASLVVFALGRLSAGSRAVEGSHAVPFAPAAARADVPVPAVEGDTFVTADGGNAYLWRIHENRIELVGQCSRIEPESRDQARFVWLPGVERRS